MRVQFDFIEPSLPGDEKFQEAVTGCDQVYTFPVWEEERGSALLYTTSGLFASVGLHS